MALTDFQRSVCRLLADARIAQGESYVAGGAALNLLMGTSRISRDIDLFHDTDEALDQTWRSDRATLLANDYDIDVVRERPSYVEARVSHGPQAVLMQWARDSAFRFFPLVRHEELGLTLHPFDLATNKVLALVGRLEVRDWVDVIACDQHIQPLGYLIWAACGKDPGFSPPSLLAEARRSSRYSAAEVAELQFAGAQPDAADLSRTWRRMLDQSDAILASLPPQEAGKAVLSRDGQLFCGNEPQVRLALSAGRILFHAGTIRGVFPTIADAPR